ncbi:MerR family transcriptional regulator [Yoonia sp. BS5-3]|uniref:MerR family transcriptional regulator n=1 Tax=Yoonia phaeophyticola TaxID=3137369 RepID=A0ABZ2V1Z1_9RHOB
MAKAKDAFRTISEVAEWLDTPTHVLRFWESKFSQIKPVKGAGGRRYYRPSDMELLGGIKQLLHEDGLTIKGTQKLLREKGVKYVATLGASTHAGAATPELAKPAPEPYKQPAVKKAAEAPEASKPAAPAPPAAPEPMQDMFAFDDIPPATETPPAPPPAPDLALPAFPDELLSAPGRVIGTVPADLSALHAKAAQIAPLLSRLEALRDRMRAQ